MKLITVFWDNGTTGHNGIDNKVTMEFSKWFDDYGFVDDEVEASEKELADQIYHLLKVCFEREGIKLKAKVYINETVYKFQD